MQENHYKLSSVARNAPHGIRRIIEIIVVVDWQSLWDGRGSKQFQLIVIKQFPRHDVSTVRYLVKITDSLNTERDINSQE